MDVNHITEMEDGLNDDEMEYPFEGDANASNNDQIVEDHADDAPIASGENAIVQQQVGLRKKKYMYVNDHRVVKQRKLVPTVTVPAMNKDKGPMPMSISKMKTKKPIGTPTSSKLMASAFKVTSSKNELMVLMQKSAEGNDFVHFLFIGCKFQFAIKNVFCCSCATCNCKCYC
jgi:hypothetical protein